MKNKLIILATTLLLFSLGFLGDANAANCNSAAQAFASQKGGEVLSVVVGNNGSNTVCDVTIRIPGKNGKPPRVVTKTIRL
jgi:hypothetical protein